MTTDQAEQRSDDYFRTEAREIRADFHTATAEVETKHETAAASIAAYQDKVSKLEASAEAPQQMARARNVMLFKLPEVAASLACQVRGLHSRASGNKIRAVLLRALRRFPRGRHPSARAACRTTHDTVSYDRLPCLPVAQHAVFL